jgi:hypothetical protein
MARISVLRQALELQKSRIQNTNEEGKSQHGAVYFSLAIVNSINSLSSGIRVHAEVQQTWKSQFSPYWALIIVVTGYR